MAHFQCILGDSALERVYSHHLSRVASLPRAKGPPRYNPNGRNLPTLTLSVDVGQSADLQESCELTRRLRSSCSTANVEVDFERTGARARRREGQPRLSRDARRRAYTLARTTVTGILQSWLIRHDRTSVTVENGEKFTITGSFSREQQETRQGFPRLPHDLACVIAAAMANSRNPMKR